MESVISNTFEKWYELPTSMSKQFITGFIEPFAYLINKSLSEGMFPTELKLSRLVAIFKVDDPIY